MLILFINPPRFEEVIRDEVGKVRKRNDPGQKKVQFLVQGTPGSSDVFLSFQASFHSATKRQQIILSGTLDSTLRDFHKELTGGNQDSIVMLESTEKVFIEDVVEVLGDLEVIMYEKRTKKYHQRDGTITLNSVVKSRPLNSIHREIDYPAEFMPFYLYGNEKEIHCSHMLVKSPNISLAANNITFDPSLSTEINHRQSVAELLAEGMILGLSEIPEDSMQPFPERNQDLAEEFFFRQGQKLKVKI
ncbi:L-tyrosine decarboxylase [Fusarium mexicanum]|uniref:L-tyrosine decarboxylase n=1 Tax=Fusarium mexicanum TaxID=751941 RepID=A0A8H5N1Z8_9HYPO|nr:L-tyrosine decarboxylase [Fusarium mexicanum]